MSTTIRHKYKYFHSTVQGAKDRWQKFHFCGLSSVVRPELNLSIIQKICSCHALMEGLLATSDKGLTRKKIFLLFKNAHLTTKKSSF